MAAETRRPARRLARLLLVLAMTLGAAANRPADAQTPAGTELVMFEEAGCPWCRRWDEEVGPAYSRSDEARRAPLRRIHIAEARRSGLKLAAPVNVTPTFVVVDRGTEIGRITGYPGADFFWGMLEGLLARLPPAPAAPIARDARLREVPYGSPGTGVALAAHGQQVF